MTQTSHYNLVASIHLNSRGFGFVLFEGPLAPLDWGTVEARGKEKRETLLARIDALFAGVDEHGPVFAQYQPNVIVLQDMSERGTHRPHSIRHLNEAIMELAEKYGFPVLFFSRADVRQCFAYLGAVTK